MYILNNANTPIPFNSLDGFVFVILEELDVSIQNLHGV